MSKKNDSTEKLFSIIVPVYNVEDYVEQCVHSIINQSEKSFELIIVDDGSTDTSGEICDQIALYNPSIRVVHKKNNGLISARRCGLRLCRGKYVVFVDADDYLDVDALKIIKQIIESEQVDIVAYRWKLIDEYGNKINDNAPPLFSEGVVKKEDFVRELLGMSNLNSLCLKACKYTLFDVDKPYDDYYSIRNGEDLLQTIPLIMKCNSIYYCQERIYNYRANLKGMTHSFQKSRILVLSIVAPELYKSVEAMGMMSKENRTVFFLSYNNIIWNILLQLFRSALSISEQEEILSTIMQYEFVNRAKVFFYKNKELFPMHIRNGLECVYKTGFKSRYYFSLMNTIRSILLFFRSITRRCKSFI